jgi:hypothetical protein
VVDLIQRWIEEPKSWNLSRDRKELFHMISSWRSALHGFLNQPKIKNKLSFIDPDLPFEVHALRPSTRVDLRGKPHLQWIIEITQWLPGYLDAKKAKTLNTRIVNGSAEEKMKLRKSQFDYRFRGGATLLVDAESGQVRYSIRKSLSDPQRSERQRRYMAETANLSLYATYFRQSREQEPFAVLHRF